MKTLAYGAAIAALSIALPTAAPAQRTPGAVIVVVDTARVYRDCIACKAAQAQLQTQITSLQQRAQQLGQPIQAEMQSIEQAAATARNQQGAVRTAAEAALQTRVQALQTRQNTANQEIQGREQTIRSTQANVVQQLNARLNPIVNQVMTAHSANLALDTESTLARAQALDVTNEVLAALDQQLPSVNVVPLPAPPAGTAPQPPGR